MIGIVLLLASVLVMPILAAAKLWVAARGNMPVVTAAAKETIACSYLSLTALAGLVASWLFGWWWLDSVVALIMIPWLMREGVEGLRGDACFEGTSPCWCRPCMFGLRACSLNCCEPACC